MDRQGARIGRSGASEVAKLRRGRIHVAHAIVLQARGRSEVVHFTEVLQSAQIFRHGPKRVVLDPGGNGQNAVLFQKIADRELFGGGVFLPAGNIFG